MFQYFLNGMKSKRLLCIPLISEFIGFCTIFQNSYKNHIISLVFFHINSYVPKTTKIYMSVVTIYIQREQHIKKYKIKNSHVFTPFSCFLYTIFQSFCANNTDFTCCSLNLFKIHPH